MPLNDWPDLLEDLTPFWKLRQAIQSTDENTANPETVSYSNGFGSLSLIPTKLAHWDKGYDYVGWERNSNVFHVGPTEKARILGLFWYGDSKATPYRDDGNPAVIVLRDFSRHISFNSARYEHVLIAESIILMWKDASGGRRYGPNVVELKGVTIEFGESGHRLSFDSIGMRWFDRSNITSDSPSRVNVGYSYTEEPSKIPETGFFANMAGTVHPESNQFFTSSLDEMAWLEATKHPR